MIWKKRRCMHHDNCNIRWSIFGLFYWNEYLCTIVRRIYINLKKSNARLKQGIWTEKGAIYTSFDNNQFITLIWVSVWKSFIPQINGIPVTSRILAILTRSNIFRLSIIYTSYHDSKQIPIQIINMLKKNK